jgi:hypothetical protein
MHRWGSSYSGSKRNCHWLLHLFWRRGACTSREPWGSWSGCSKSVAIFCSNRVPPFPFPPRGCFFCSRPNQLLGSVLTASLNVLAGNKSAQPVRHLFFCLPLNRTYLAGCCLSINKYDLAQLLLFKVGSWELPFVESWVMTCSRFIAWLHAFVQIG